MVETHKIERTPVRESAPAKDTFSGGDRIALYEQHANTVGGGRGGFHGAAGAGNDAALPTHLTFNDSIYGSAAPTAYPEARIQQAAFKQNDTPDAPRSSPLDRARQEVFQDATKYGFGETNGVVDTAKGKDDLKMLVQNYYLNGGKDGLQQLANDFNNAGIDKYGEHAFDKAGKEFDKSLAVFSTKPNKDGSTDVKFDFAQPNSKEVNSVSINVPKPEVEHLRPHPITGNYEL